MLRSRSRRGEPNWIDRLQDAGLSRRELASEINHMYMAYNAIDYAATAALYELGRRRELQCAIRTELQSNLGGGRPTISIACP